MMKLHVHKNVELGTKQIYEHKFVEVALDFQLLLDILCKWKKN